MKSMAFILNGVSRYFGPDAKLARLLIYGSGAALFANLLAVLTTFFLEIYLARILGATGYGVFAYARSWLIPLTFIGVFGFTILSLRYVSSYIANQEYDLLRGFMVRGFQFVIVSSFLTSVFFYFFIDAPFSGIDKEFHDALYTACLVVPLFSLLLFWAAAIRASKRVALGTLPQMVLQPLIFLVIVFLFYRFSSFEIDASAAMFLFLMAFFFTLVITWGILRKVLPREILKAKPSYLTYSWLVVAAPLMFIQLLQNVEKQTDILLIGYILNPELTGIYAAAKKIIIVISFGLTSVNAIAAPVIAGYYAQKKLGEIKKTIRIYSICIQAISLPVFLVIVAFGETFLGLFGERFHQAYNSLLILAAGQYIKTLAGNVEFFMMMTGHHNQAAVILLASVLIQVLGTTILIPMFGIEGAALANVIAVLFMTLVMSIYIKFKMGIDVSVFSLFHHFQDEKVG